MKATTKELLKRIGLLSVANLVIMYFVNYGGIITAVVVAAADYYIVERLKAKD